MYSTYNHPIYGKCIATIGCCKKAKIKATWLDNTTFSDATPIDLAFDCQSLADDVCKILEAKGTTFTPEFSEQTCISCRKKVNMQVVDTHTTRCANCTNNLYKISVVYHPFK